LSVNNALGVHPFDGGTGGRTTEKQDRIAKAKALFYELYGHFHCFSSEQVERRIMELRQLSPMYGMCARRAYKRWLRKQEYWRAGITWPTTDRIESQKRYLRRKAKKQARGGHGQQNPVLVGQDHPNERRRPENGP
jgi:hypothetical protein